MRVKSFKELDQAFEKTEKDITLDNKVLKLKQLKEQVLSIMVEVEEDFEREYDDLLKLL